jgi:hypothetical protein
MSTIWVAFVARFFDPKLICRATTQLPIMRLAHIPYRRQIASAICDGDVPERNLTAKSGSKMLVSASASGYTEAAITFPDMQTARDSQPTSEFD